ncbi:MAG: antitoxin [Acidimicrobiia bacterium]
MSRQIAIRLAEDLVEFVDSEVKDGAAQSRAQVVGRALERERRRRRAERDLEILLASDDPDELDGLARFAQTLPID